MTTTTVKTQIAKFQKRLDIAADGYWGTGSSESARCSNYMFYLSPEFTKELPVDKAKFKQSNVDNMLAEFNIDPDTKNPLYIAYMLATAYHETARTFVPLEEYGKGRTRTYGKIASGSLVSNGAKGYYDFKKYPFFYYGRGFVQLTWFCNYDKFSKILGIDLLNRPELACDVNVATKIMIYGMLNGTFTGKKLSSYIKYGLDPSEFVNARRIINGTDKAGVIAKYAVTFLKYLELR